MDCGQCPDGKQASSYSKSPGMPTVFEYDRFHNRDTLIRRPHHERQYLPPRLLGAVSQATVVKAAQAGAEILQPTVQGIGQAAVSSAVLHADETGIRVAKKLHWLHVLASDALTWIGCHPKRGTEAFQALALLQQFRGVLVHDGWMPYKALQCQHALCNAHHLRELTYLLEEQGQAWAGDMIELLTHASHLDNVNCADGQSPNYNSQKYQTQVRDLRHLYDAIPVHGNSGYRAGKSAELEELV